MLNRLNPVLTLSYMLSAAAGAVIPLNMAIAADPSCIDYYTIGESKCQPAASTPVQMPGTPANPQLMPPQKADAVDEYMKNYGKPPREFVEFYLNPTSENAQKWVTAYQQMMKKGQDMSKAWTDAEQLYMQSAPGQVQPQLIAPVSQAPQVQPEEPQPVAVPVAPPVQRSIGAFSGATPGLGRASASGVAGSAQGLEVTYYFSQVCPYCARMTPDLQTISTEKAGKLKLTCVDVTPSNSQVSPNPTYITSKLPCQWRLPEQGEVASQEVRQTPTLVIKKPGMSPVRLSGYVPLAQLRQYF